VLLMLDRHATPFTRIWCCFEESITVLAKDSERAAPLLLDIATAHDGQAMLLTEGFTDNDKEEGEEKRRQGFDEARVQQATWESKQNRERDFPVPVVRKGFSVSIADAKASQEIDKTRILNAIAGRRQELVEL